MSELGAVIDIDAGGYLIDWRYANRLWSLLLWYTTTCARHFIFRAGQTTATASAAGTATPVPCYATGFRLMPNYKALAQQAAGVTWNDARHDNRSY